MRRGLSGAPLAATNESFGGSELQAAWRHASRGGRGGSAAGRGIRRLVGFYLEL